MDGVNPEIVSLKYRHSELLDQFFDALSKAQGEMDGAKKDATNPHFRSKYADLESVMDACRPALSKYGIAILQPTSANGVKVTVTTLLGHKSGQWLAADLEMTSAQNTPQGIGSTITYGRRYGLSAMAGIAPEDDDGNAGSMAGSKQAQAAVLEEKLTSAGVPPAQARAVAEKHVAPSKSKAKPNLDDWGTDGIARFHKSIDAMKEVLGEAEYRRILGNEGYENRAQLLAAGRQKSLAVYQVMVEALKEKRERDLEVSEADMPSQPAMFETTGQGAGYGVD